MDALGEAFHVNVGAVVVSDPIGDVGYAADGELKLTVKKDPSLHGPYPVSFHV
jgi:hypothetical protein